MVGTAVMSSGCYEHPPTTMCLPPLQQIHVLAAVLMPIPPPPRGTFKSLTFSANEFEEVPLEPVLEVSEPSVSEASIEIQDIFQHTSNAVVEEPLQDPAEPVGPQGQALNTNMAETGKITVSSSKFYGDGKEDVEKWLRSFERISEAN